MTSRSTRPQKGSRTGRALVAALFCIALLPAFGLAQGQNMSRSDMAPGATADANPIGLDVKKNVKFEQKLDQQAPGDVVFRDETGKDVHLSDYYGKKPVVLVLIQYECKMLCTQVLNGTLHSLFDLELTPGKDFEIVTVSIDPRETPELAAEKKQAYYDKFLKESHRSLDAEGWHFLTGDQANIDRLADSIGYRYVYDEKSDQYAHPSGIVVLTPTGKIARYFYGIQYPTTDVRLGLVEASSGKIGSPVDQLLLLCYHYDPQTGTYGPAIMRFLRIFGAAMVVAVIAFIVVMLRRERNRPLPAGPSVP